MEFLLPVVIAAAAASVLFLITCASIVAINNAFDSCSKCALFYIIASVIVFGFFAALTICAIVITCKLSITWLTLVVLF